MSLMQAILLDCWAHLPIVHMVTSLDVGIDIGECTNLWTNPLPIMPTLRIHFALLYSFQLWIVSLLMSTGSEPDIYLRGVIPHTLIYGGLGHRPPPYEELILLGLYCGSRCQFLGRVLSHDLSMHFSLCEAYSSSLATCLILSQNSYPMRPIYLSYLHNHVCRGFVTAGVTRG